MRLYLCLLMLSMPACGGTGQRAESAASCNANWQKLTSSKPWDVTSALVYNDGTLYYGSDRAGAIIAQPADGSPERVLASVPTLEIWLEGDHLLFSQGSQALQIGSVLLSGGAPQLLLDGGTGRTSAGLAVAHAFTPTDFYWSEIPFPAQMSPTTVWHQSRSGGTPEQLGTIMFQKELSGNAMALSHDTVLIAALSGEAYALPITGGAAAPLASPAALFTEQLVGLDPLGAYTSVYRSDNDLTPLMLSPADGGPAKSFWPTMPDALVNGIWPTLEGGWVVVAIQRFDDGLIHTTITLLDSHGTATRIGCSPGTSSQAWIRTRVAVAPDAVYVATGNLDAATWEIDRIAR